ncbi:MAG: PAS domain S-box protein, partial [Caldilineaceae bacterium]|nr:PAS domain S-box protein [Caldilineaceae bacterium]
MPLTLRYPTRPLQLLVFDDSGIYQQPLAESLATGQIKVESVYVHTVQAFQAALSNKWDAFVVAFPVADVALARLRDTAPIRRMILLYSSAEEEDAFALATEELCDLLAHDQLRRLPLLLRREWQLKESQAGLFALHQLERSFRGIVDGFGDAILFTDADQLVRYANSALERLYGYQSSSLLGKPFTTFVPPAEQATIQHLLANLLRCAGTIETVTHRFHHANGDWAYVETTGHSMPDPTGHLFIVLHLRDISDRKRTEETLLESEQRLRLFVEHAPAAIAMFDREMKYLSVSRRWLTDYRISETNIIGRSHYEIFPNLSPQWHTIHQRCLQGAVAQSEADPFPRADGTVDWVHWEIYPWRNKLCEIGGIVLFSEVITERKRAQEAEREQRLLAEAMRDSLAALTASTDVETVMQQILDYSTRVVPSEAGAIILFTEGQARIAYMRGHSPEAEAFFNANPNLFDMAIYQKSNGGQTYYLAADTLHTPDWHIFPTTAWIRSSLGVQIVLHGEPIGLLTADSAMPNQYAQKDVETLQTFARYAALALERVHHVTLLEQRVRERTVELEAAKTRVEAILDNSPDGILLIDANLVIQQSNGAFHQLFHCTAADCRNQSLLTFIHPEDTSSLQQLMQMVVAEKQSKYIEIRA